MERINSSIPPLRAHSRSIDKSQTSNADCADVILILGPRTQFEKAKLLQAADAHNLNVYVIGDGVSPLSQSDIELSLTTSRASTAAHIIVTGHGSVQSKDGSQHHETCDWATSELITTLANTRNAEANAPFSGMIHLSACEIEAVLKDLAPKNPLWNRVALMLHGGDKNNTLQNSVENLTAVFELLEQSKKAGVSAPNPSMFLQKITEIAGDSVSLVGGGQADAMRHDPLDHFAALLREELNRRRAAGGPFVLPDLSPSGSSLSRRKLINIFYTLALHDDVGRIRAALAVAPNLVHARTVTGATPLHIAAEAGHEATVTLLLEKGAKINELDDEKSTPLNLACEANSLAVVAALLEHGADPNLANSSEVAPLHAACSNGNFDSVGLLLRAKADVNAATSEGVTPLMEACQQGLLEICNLLMREPSIKCDLVDKLGGTALHRACLASSASIVKTLAPRSRANFLQRNFDKERPLDIALNSKNYKVINFLISAGSSAGFKFEGGANLLHRSAQLRDARLLRMVLRSCDLSLEETTSYGETALHCACACGADEIVKILIKEEAFLESIDAKGMTPLAAACARGSKSTVALLVKSQAEIDCQDLFGRFPLHHASRRQDQDTTVIRLLLENDADLNCVDQLGRTPLMHAAESGNSKAVDFLLACGADRVIADVNKKTAADLVGDLLRSPDLTWERRADLILVKKRLELAGQD